MTNERIEKAVTRAMDKHDRDFVPNHVLVAKIVEAVLIDLFGENPGKKEGD